MKTEHHCVNPPLTDLRLLNSTVWNLKDGQQLEDNTMMLWEPRKTQDTDPGFITLKVHLMTYERGAERRPIKAMTFQ